MSLIQTWAPYFPSSVRRNGRACHLEGCVAVEPASERGLVRARIQGAQSEHTVEVHSGQDGPTARCTCAAFADGHRCKHIWATLLEIDSRSATLSEHGWDLDTAPPRLHKARKRADGDNRPRATEPQWSGRLSLLRPSSVEPDASNRILPAARRDMCYVVLANTSHRHGALVVETRQRNASATGWSKTKPLKIDASTVSRFEQQIDRELGSLLLGAATVVADDLAIVAPAERPRSTFALRPGAQRFLLKKMIASGRCYLERHGEDGIGPATITLIECESGDEAWVLWMVATTVNNGLDVRVELRRGEQRAAIEVPWLVLGGPDGLVIADAKVAALDDRGASRWISQFRDEWNLHGSVKPMSVPAHDVQKFLDRLYLMSELPDLDLPDGVGRPHRAGDMKPLIELGGDDGVAPSVPRGSLTAKIWFEYEGHHVKPNQPGRFLTIEGDTGMIARDRGREQSAINSLTGLGFTANPADEGASLVLAARRMPEAVTALIRDGWRVLANGHVIQRPGASAFTIRSGIDWFELRGGIRYDTENGEQIVGLPEILAAARAGQNTITLGDGSQGLLPHQWLEDHRLLSALGRIEDDHLRFGSSQAALIDGLLGAQQLVDVDKQFEEVRQRINNFDRIHPEQEPEKFRGELRPYQRDGLGWISFLRLIGMGGILADDMGLGKTVQVLAMLESRYGAADERPNRPTLIVVPRSVAFNWIDEANRFTPGLRVQSYTGSERQQLRDAFKDHDVIVTTYGLLRRDIAELRQHTFDYVILDEAQAIKNPQSQSAKAARLIEADHRLALTGTPVENHLGDIWSIFEYLNPGMLGSATRFGDLVHGETADAVGGGRSLQSVDVASQAGRALRPFILRRTKRQVLNELPEKTDQTLLCTMEAPQRKVYDQLLQYYQDTLLRQVTATPGRGLGSSAFMVLEALLRLRQASCHPGLIDPKRADDPSAKMEVLLEHLEQLVDEGHKALVFSQFTSMLALVRKRLDRDGMKYEYLDGQTRNRRKRINHFQEDPNCPVFLISLKAGGLGLNLTAANYVFILDPWWNPAVEIQAIDRAHRIGQTQHVFAYRLICEDTVEQKITELQEKKRKLADAIIGGQENLLRTLTRDDLTRLLS